MMRPRPLHELPAAAWRRVRGVLTDIDDTLTRDGAIEPQALAALSALHDGGVPVIAVTGRPALWSEPFALAWPVAGIVAENGAVLLHREGDRLAVEFAHDEATRAVNARRLRDVQAEIVATVPGAFPARDSAGRLTDIAIDHSEFAHLDAAAIAAVVARMRAAGMRASVSSIHVNGWFGDHDKLSGARWAVQRLHGEALDTDDWVYVGDSTNDEAMFDAFALSVGVANLRRFAAELRVWPAWLAAAERGAGFAEVAAQLLAARS